MENALHPWKNHLLPSSFKKYLFSRREFIWFLVVFYYCISTIFPLLVGKTLYTPLTGQLWGATGVTISICQDPRCLWSFLSTRQQTVKAAEPEASEHFAREPGEQRTDKGSTCLWVWNSLGPWIECKYTLKILLSDTVPASSGLLSWKIFWLRSFSQQKNSI